MLGDQCVLVLSPPGQQLIRLPDGRLQLITSSTASTTQSQKQPAAAVATAMKHASKLVIASPTAISQATAASGDANTTPPIIMKTTTGGAPTQLVSAKAVEGAGGQRVLIAQPSTTPILQPKPIQTVQIGGQTLQIRPQVLPQSSVTVMSAGGAVQKLAVAGSTVTTNTSTLLTSLPSGTVVCPPDASPPRVKPVTPVLQQFQQQLQQQQQQAKPTSAGAGVISPTQQAPILSALAAAKPALANIRQPTLVRTPSGAQFVIRPKIVQQVAATSTQPAIVTTAASAATPATSVTMTTVTSPQATSTSADGKYTVTPQVVQQGRCYS